MQVTGRTGAEVHLTAEEVDLALLATARDGSALSAAEGGPLRLIVPGRYAEDMLPWVEAIRFTADARPAGPEVSPFAYFRTPHPMERLIGGVTFKGVAFGGRRVIHQVMLQIDGGPWLPLDLAPAELGCWVEWSASWTPPAPGDYEVCVKARLADDGSETPPQRIIVRIVT